MSVLTGLMLLIGFVAGYLLGIPITYTLGIFLAMAVLMNLAIYWFADKWGLELYHV